MSNSRSTVIGQRAAALLAIVTAALVSATARATLIDLRNAAGNGGSFGNSLSFSTDGVSVTVTGFGETGPETPQDSNFYLFETAEVWSWSTGIGVCNREEGSISASSCSSSEHEVDTVNRDDLVVFQFDQTVNFERLTVDPYNGPGSDPNDRNIIYWVGNADELPDLTVETFFTLGALAGFADEVESGASSSYAPFTHALSGTGNILLLSGDYHDLNCKNYNSSSNLECEAYKIADIRVSVVPLPAALPLLLSGLAGAGWLARRRRQADI